MKCNNSDSITSQKISREKDTCMNCPKEITFYTVVFLLRSSGNFSGSDSPESRPSICPRAVPVCRPPAAPATGQRADGGKRENATLIPSPQYSRLVTRSLSLGNIDCSSTYFKGLGLLLGSGVAASFFLLFVSGFNEKCTYLLAR